METPWDEDEPPDHIEFGNRFEPKARDEFLKGHRFRHRGCHVSVPGLRLDAKNPFLGASPDGIFTCKKCVHDKVLLEIKCLSSKRTFQPGTALTLLKICTRQEDGSLAMNKKHRYYYQMQGQMAITGIHMCYLVAYTYKGIKDVEVPYDKEFSENMISKLNDFYEKYCFPIFKAVGHA